MQRFSVNLGICMKHIAVTAIEKWLALWTEENTSSIYFWYCVCRIVWPICQMHNSFSNFSVRTDGVLVVVHTKYTISEKVESSRQISRSYSQVIPILLCLLIIWGMTADGFFFAEVIHQQLRKQSQQTTYDRFLQLSFLANNILSAGWQKLLLSMSTLV